MPHIQLKDCFDAVVMLTWSNWKTEPRSNRYHYATRLARSLPVLFVQPSLPAGPDPLEQTEVPGVTLVHAGSEYGEGQSERLDEILAARDIRRPLIWVYNVYFGDFVRRRANNFVVYHATEDYLHRNIDLQGLSDPESVVKPLKHLLRSVDFLLAVSPDVLDSYIQRGGYRGPSAVARNGCDDAFWRSHSAHEFVPPSNGRPVALYQGNINGRLDFSLIAAIADQMPDWDFWFCGTAHQAEGWSDVLTRPNVYHLGRLPIERVAAVSRHASIGLIPFVDHSLMRISTPLKAFEYVACGLPVVSSPNEALTDRPDLFTLAATPEEFAAAMRRLAPSRTDPVQIGRRLDAAAEQSYDRKIELVSADILEAVRSKKQEVGRLNVAVLYDDRSGHVQTIAEHLRAFGKYSEHEVFYLPSTHAFPIEGERLPEAWDLSWFDVLIVHYSIRVSIDEHFNDKIADAVRAFGGVKILFIQDEYDTTETARRWIEKLRVDVVFTCVPPTWVEHIYPSARFPRTRFVQTLTGYVPEHPNLESFALPLAERHLRIVYRGRDLPAYYGSLGREKYTIGVEAKRRAEERDIPVDIEVESTKRIYGDDWYRFLGSGRATLGTESGSNIFDFDGSLKDIVERHSDRGYEEIYPRFLASHEGPVQMNQISPKIFEAIRLRTALVLFEGTYSGVVQPDVHFIPLKKDLSNIDEVFDKLEDLELLGALTERAYRDVVESGRYSYRSFVQEVDRVICDMAQKPARAELVSVPILRRRRQETDYRAVVSDLRLAGLLNGSVLAGPGQREAVMAACDFRLSAGQSDAAPSESVEVAVEAQVPSQRAAATGGRGIGKRFLSFGLRRARAVWRLLPVSVRAQFHARIPAALHGWLKPT